MKLPSKQIHFLQALADTPRYMGKLPVIVIDNMPTEIWFTFRSERQAYKWVRNLAERGLVEVENDCFVRATELGLSVVYQ